MRRRSAPRPTSTHPLGLHRDRAGEDLLGEAERQLDGVLLERRPATSARSCPIDSSAAAIAATEGWASSRAAAMPGGAALGLARGARLGADLLGLRADGRQDVGDAVLVPGGGASSCWKA